VDIVKALQVDFAALREGMTRTLIDASISDAGPKSAGSLTADRASIRPLTMPDALQILIAEARASLSSVLLESPGLVVTPGQTDAMIQNAPQAASRLTELYLKFVPEDVGHPAPWLEAIKVVQAAFDGSVERALDIVSKWREVPREIVDAVNEAHTLALAALGDEPPAGLWVRPEWVGLAPQLARLRRLRRRARRRLTDPDFWGAGDADEESPKR
jgi:hypothetical protein